MSQLSKIEEQFLAEKQARQSELTKARNSIREAIEPLDKEYNELRQDADIIFDKMRVIAKDRANKIQDSGLVEIEKELADVARDVTKILRKQRK
jgi:hypothetical protein